MNNQIPARDLTWDREQTYQDRFPRYAANARREACLADKAAENWSRSAGFYERAARNAQRQGDAKASELYSEMAYAARDAAVALRDIADAARDVAEHYSQKPE